VARTRGDLPFFLAGSHVSWPELSSDLCGIIRWQPAGQEAVARTDERLSTANARSSPLHSCPHTTASITPPARYRSGGFHYMT